MGKTRSPNRDKAYEIYKENNGKITPKEIAEMLGERLVNIYAWKKNDEWDIKLNGKVGAPFGNKNAVGNKGGAPKGNLNNLQHGDYYDPTKHLEKDFLKKYIPTATKKIIQETTEAGLNSLDILWTNIRLQFAQIIRSQKIMHVKNQNDLTKELKRTKDSWGKESQSEEREYELQFAWDKQERFLTSQSKAMATLQNMISKYEELLHKNWDLATEEQKLRVEKLKADLSKDTKKDEPIQIVIKRKSKE